MAGYAIPDKGGMIRRAGTTDNRGPICGDMAGVTFLSGGIVCRSLALGNHTIVTARTDSNDFGMVDCAGCNRCPQRRILLMTGVAHVCAVNVGRTLATGNAAIMAGDAVTRECGVIRHCAANDGRPVCGDVAVTTFLSGSNVGRPLALRNHTIMTTRAHTNNLGMIHGGSGNGCPHRELCLGVAGIAHIAGVDVIGTLRCRDGTVVATGTGTGNLVVIHGCGGDRHPRCRAHRMTGIAGTRTGDM